MDKHTYWLEVNRLERISARIRFAWLDAQETGESPDMIESLFTQYQQAEATRRQFQIDNKNKVVR